MGLRQEWKQLTFKDRMELLEAFCTIIVSIMALWGSVRVWESGFFHKLGHLVDHYHEQVVREEGKLDIIEKHFS